MFKNSKSVFHKFLFTYIVVALIGLLISFLVFRFSATVILSNMVKDRLEKVATEISTLANGKSDIVEKEFQRMIEMIYRNNFAKIDVVALGSEEQANMPWGKREIKNYKENYLLDYITADKVKEVVESDEKKYEKIHIDSEDSDILILSMPLVSGDNVKGAVFIHIVLKNIYSEISSSYTMFMIIFMLASMYTFISFYIISLNFTKPLIQMSNVARNISKGKFDSEVEYEGNDEIGVLASSINDMSKNLQQENKAQKDFIANISHELRTPLTTIQANTQGILDGVIEENEIKDYLNVNLEESKRLTSLVNELIELSSKDKGENKIYLEPIDISHLLNQAMKQMDIKISEKNINVILDIDEGVIIDIDKNKIKQVVINIIDNAIKYNKENGKIKVSLKEFKNYVKIDVEDNGIGMDKSEVEKVFERFKKYNNSKGLGIGLSICKSIVEMHKGDIIVNSEKGKYTKITIKLPKNK